MKSLISLLILGVSFNAAAALKVSNADGWIADNVKDDKIAQMVVPGAELVLHRNIKLSDDQSYNLTITVRKVQKSVSDLSKNDKDSWMRTLFSAEKLKQIAAPKEKQKIINVDGQPRFITELSYQGDADTPHQAAVLGLTVGEDVYLVLFEQTGKLYSNNKKSALELFRKIKIEVAAEEAPAKSE